MDKRLNGKVALITGAGDGIGRAAAILFANHGAKIVVADINGITGEETVSMIHKIGGEAIYINVHIGKSSDCHRMADVVNNTYGKLDILVNNAGIMHHQDGDVIDMDERIWDMTMAVNIKGTFLACKYCIPILQQSGGGAIINMSSFVALKGSAISKMAYSASKGAILSLTKDLAARYADDSIRVNAVCPGPTLTKSFEAFLNHHPEIKTNYLKYIPMQQFGTSNDIAHALLYLASSESSFVTGINLNVDGGISCI